ncbi:F-box domain-containing protein [Mycena indigotica]|uniref:F-box domain-containing protein n=1 Tax=Mycena indigotica TaxID=2126181 RepID=A0A8H6SZB6_9AGAR|nr:F-box domain-containing protein [Mycena indigotica]KAF7307421.1 F-box domain-containing protein [Mycena indigotica]
MSTPTSSAKLEASRKPQAARILEMPFELISEIMQIGLLLTVPNRENNTGRMSYVTGLASVCTRFREIALETPQLWVLEYFDILGYPLNAKTQRFLDRSKPCTFRVIITSPNGEDSDDEDYDSFSDEDEEPGNDGLSDMVASGFGDTMDRWGEVVAIVHAPSELTDLAGLSPGYLTNLTKLHFELALMREQPWKGPPLRLFSVAPRLSQAIIRLHKLSKPVSVLLPLPWAQLKDLTIELDTLDSTFATLVLCQNLVSLSLAVLLTHAEIKFTHPKITLPALEKLDLHVLPIATFGSLCPALEALMLPALKRFEVEFGPEAWVSEQVATALEKFLTNNPSITNLVVGNITDTPLLRILRCLPKLTELSIADNGLAEVIDDKLLQALSDGKLVPAVQSLELLSGTKKLKEPALFRMISTRWQEDNGFAKLKRCRVEAEYLLNDDFFAKIKALRDEGLVWEFEVKVPDLDSDEENSEEDDYYRWESYY